MYKCNVCETELASLAECETATVRSNVRRFREESFGVWRCAACGSIHAKEAVDLDHYYADYPLARGDIDAVLHPGYASFERRLVKAGFEKRHAILDFGCGSGSLVRYLERCGYANVVGYDGYASKFRDPSLLLRRYDCIVSQDVIEHVDDPLELLQKFDRLVQPGGRIVIGTPDADAINLSRPGDFIHALHAPYHRHILSARALRESAQRLGWRLDSYHSRRFGSTLMPGQNARYGQFYLKCFDDTLDLVAEPIRFDHWRLWTPKAFFLACFGYFLDPRTDVMFAFRSPERGALPAWKEQSV